MTGINPHFVLDHHDDLVGLMDEVRPHLTGERDPAEFMATALRLLTDAGLAPKGRERRIYELTREDEPMPSRRGLGRAPLPTHPRARSPMRVSARCCGFSRSIT